MRKSLFLWMLLIALRGAAAQNIIQAEYFIDKDPGVGNATQAAFSPSANLVLNFSADISGLQNGFHSLYFRSKDVNGNWSVLHVRTFFTAYDDNTPVSVNIEQMEYFVDTDPGVGNGTNISITPGTSATKSFSVDMTGLSGGFHTLYVRSRDANGLWNVAPASTFYRVPDAIVDPLANIMKMEYFIDTDPGFGNAADIAISLGTNITPNFSVDLTNIRGGFHTLYIRTQDTDGLWNVAPASVFYRVPDVIVDPLANLVKMEYFIDKDPGFGNAADVAITPGTSINKSFSIDMTSLSGGFHTLYVRTQDSDGLWNVAPASVFYRVPDAIVDPLADVVKMEYFIDKDPGFSLGNDIAFTSSSDVSKSFAVDLTSIPAGFHTLYIRAKDADGLWNVVEANPFYIPSVDSSRLVKITELNYFFTKNSVNTPVRSYTAFTPSVDAGVNFSPDQSGLEIDSIYDIHLFAKDSAGLRGLEFSQSFTAVDVPPAAPSGLIGVAVNGQVHISWRRNIESDFQRYRIYRGTSPGASEQVDSTTGGISDTTKVITGLTNGTLYFFRVAAIDTGANVSNYSNEVAAVPVIEQGNALSLDGIDDHVDLGNWFNLQTFTISMWVKDGGAQMTYADILDNNHTNSRSWVLQYDNTGNQYHFSGAGDAEGITINLTPGSWQHLAITRTLGDSTRLYLGGRLIKSVPTVTYTYDGTQHLRISAWGGGGRHWNGQVDELSIWNVALDQGQIVHAMSRPSRGDEPGIVGLWHFDEPSGVTAYDASSSSYNGTLINGSAFVPSGAMSPNAPNLTSAVAGNYSVSLTWQKNTEPDLLRYRIFSGTTANPTNQIDSTANAGDTSKVITGLSFGNTYHFRIAAVDNVLNKSNYSNELSAVPSGTPLGLSTSVLQNPALSKYADFYVISDTTLSDAPAVKLFIGTDSSSIAMSATSNVRIYKGSVAFTQSGNYNIRTQAMSVTGAASTNYHPFNVTLSKPGLFAALSSVNGKALLKIGSGAVKEETYFTVFQNEKAQEMIYEFGPKAALKESVELTMTYDPLSWPNAEKLFIYHKEGDNWTRLRTQVYAGEMKVKTRVSALGQFKLGYDPSYEGTNVVPATFALKQNYPNPFNPSTTISYDIPEDTRLNLTIYNLLGQKVKTLYSGNQIAGSYQAIWNGTNDRGQTVASGIYFYRLETQSFVKTQKMLFIK